MLRLFKVSMLLTACLLSFDIVSQPVLKLWDNVIQANAQDGAFLEMIKTKDNKVLAACITWSDSGYDKTMNSPPSGGSNWPWILMLDMNGNKLWDRDFWGPGRSMGLTEWDTSKYILASETGPSGVGGHITAPSTAGAGGVLGCWKVCVNDTGSILWQKRFDHGTDTININHSVNPLDIKAINGAAYVLASTSRNADVMTGGDFTALNCVTVGNSNNVDILLYKVNPNDTLTNEWQKVYGGDTSEIPVFLYPIENDNGFSGFFIGGFTLSLASCNQTVSSHTIPYYDYLVIRTDTSGNTIWQQRYGGGKNDYLNGILDAGNGNFLLYGRTTSPVSFDITDAGFNDTAIWLVKIDGNGSILWDKRFGACNGFSIMGNDVGGLVSVEVGSNTVAGINTSDGGFLFVSNVKNNLPCGDVSEPGQGYEDYWMFKLDSNGTKIWDKRFGGPGFDVAQRVVEMSPGYYIVGGYSRGNMAATLAAGGDKSEVTIGYKDLWFVGVVDSAAILALTNEYQQQINFSIYPNPSIDEFNISIKNNIQSIYNLKLIDITGKIILKQKIDANAKISVGSLSKGIYILEVSDQSGNQSTKKLVKW